MEKNRVICRAFYRSKRGNPKMGHLFINLVLISYLVSNVSCLENYDFIIVGGGTGGLAVARRLAENGKHSVLVLESGDLPKEGMDVPAFGPRFTMDPDVTFQYKSTRQRNAGLQTNGTISLAVGRVLSGTSNINSMWFNRGNPQDYDNWGNLTQDSSWNYSNMLKYFKRVETYAGDFPSDQHGYNGPITVSRPRYAPGLEQWLSAGRSLGYPISDPNGPQQISFTPVEFAKRFGRRVSSFKGYVEPILATTPKLRIILNTNVTQIIFEGKHAVGVRFQSKAPELQGIQDKCIYANKEIIVSAGTYGSPQILLRSGIGPRNVLRTSGIPIIQDLPVGQNFQDHVHVPLSAILNNRSEAIVLDEDRDLTPENWIHFNRFGDGPFSHGGSGQAFLVSSVAKLNGEYDWPDIQLALSHSVQAGLSSNLLEDVKSWEAPVRVSVIVVRPRSRGSIKLNARDHNGLPILDIGYLSDERDVEALLDGFKATIKVFEETPSYKKLGARIPYVDIPMCRKFQFRSDNYWRCYIRYASSSACHPAGTCKMGWGAQDPTAVVDTQLRVIGIEGLRVVDASVMPTVTNSNTHAAVYGIAEKASDMILRDWEL